MSRIVVECLHERERQFAARVNIAEEHICQTVAAFCSAVPCLDDSRHFIYPRHSHGITRHIDNHQTLVSFRQSLDKLILSVRQVVGLTVGVLTVLMRLLVQAAHEDNYICLLGSFDSIADHLSRSARVIKLLAKIEVVLNNLLSAGIAALIHHLKTAFLLCFVLYTLQGRHLILHFQLRRPATDGHHLDSVLAHHEYVLVFGAKGQERALVLEQHHALGCHLASRSHMRLRHHRPETAVLVHRGAEDKTQHVPHFLIHLLLGISAFCYPLEQRVGKEIVVVLTVVGGGAVGPCAIL